MTFIEPLNLQMFLVNIFAGTPEIFLFISFIVINGMAAFFRMDGTTTLLMIMLFIILMSPFVGQTFLFFMIALAIIPIAINIGRIVRTR